MGPRRYREKKWDGRYGKKLAGPNGTLVKKLERMPASARVNGRHCKKTGGTLEKTGASLGGDKARASFFTDPLLYYQTCRLPLLERVRRPELKKK